MQAKAMIITTIAGAGLFGAMMASAAPPSKTGFDAEIARNAQTMLDEGKKTFRFDTFGDEAFWGDALQLHKAIAGEKNGGVGPGVSPKTALSVGLKVDADALPDAYSRPHSHYSPAKPPLAIPLRSETSSSHFQCAFSRTGSHFARKCITLGSATRWMSARRPAIRSSSVTLVPGITVRRNTV